MFYGFNSLNFRLNDKATKRRFRNQSIDIKYVSHGNHRIRYLTTTNYEALNVVCFIHGAPGSSQEYIGYMQNEDLLSDYRVISLDRPGYGGSELGNVVVSIKAQAEILFEVLREEGMGRSMTVLGHSYGAPVAAAIAMIDRMSLVDRLILVSGAMDPSLEKYFWFNKLTGLPFVKSLMSRALKVAITEKEHHVTALSELLPLWKKIKIPTTVIHGLKDDIVPVENVDFLMKHLTNVSSLNVVKVRDVDHVVQFKNPELILNAILY